MPISQIQNTFTLGELDPLLISRVDFEGYYKGARKIRNALVVPQGGIKQRFGTTFVNIILDSNGTLITDETHVMFMVFSFSKTKQYLIVLHPFIESNMPATDMVSIDIYLDGVIVATLNPPDGVPWTVSQIDSIRYVRAPDRTLFIDNGTQPYQLIRGANDATWTIEAQPFVWLPQYDFSSKDGGVAVYTGPTVTFTPSAVTGNVTITATNATPFTSNHIGGVYVGNGGVLRITAVASTTVASGFTIHDFINTSAIRGDRSLLTEPAWGNGGGPIPGAARGWPRVGTIYQNRLIYGNTTTLPNALFASNVFTYNNFDDTEATDEKGFTYSLGSDSLDEITNLVGSTSLVAITTNSLFSTNVLSDTPLTPANVFLIEQNREGGNDCLAHVIDSQIVYVNFNSNTVLSVAFDLLQSRFETSEASLLAPHLIRQPREAAIYDNPIIAEGNYYLLVNGDGTLAAYQTLKNQNVSAWTLQSTQGDFLDICANRNQSYLFIRRQTQGVGPNQQVWKTNIAFNAFTDITSQCNDTVTNVALYNKNLEYLLIGNSAPYLTVGVMLATPADVSLMPVFEYLSKTNTWIPLNAFDTTNGFTQDGIIQWTFADVIDWAPQTVNNVDRKFWIRIRQDNALVTVEPIEMLLTCDKQETINLEQLDFAYLLDSVYTVIADANGLIGGLTYLSGQQVWLLLQTFNTYNVHAGHAFGPKFVDNMGFIDMGPDFANQTFIVGIDAPTQIIAMPPVAQFNSGINVYLPKYVQSLFVDFYLSAGLIVAQREIPVLKVGMPMLDIPLTLITDFFEISPYPSRDPRVEIPITRTGPYPFMIIGLGYKVDF
jgi:hypothetical protein